MNVNNKTKVKKYEEKKHDWYLVDAEDKILGRLASKIADLLRGKNQVDYTPHVDSGAGVIVINCDKVKVTGKKADAKMYKHFSGYPGGLKETAYKKVMAAKPDYIIRHAVQGMLPAKSRLSLLMMRRLKLYVGKEHEHAAQAPKAINI